MTASLAYILGSGNSLVWSWFFWVYIHPIASILWFTFCLFALLISIEVRQLEQREAKVSKITYVKNPKPIQYASTLYTSNSGGFSATEVIEVIVNPPPQLPYSKSKDAANQKRNPKMAQVKMMQLPNSID